MIFFLFLGMWIRILLQYAVYFVLDVLLHGSLFRQQSCGMLEYRKKALQRKKILPEKTGCVKIIAVGCAWVV
jgi:hypothetical protein